MSLVLLCRNEGPFIRQCLESVLAFDDAGSDVEILVVDGRSTDRTRDVVREFEQRDHRVRLLDNPKGSKPAGLNIGIRAARGDWIIRLDAHSIYEADYVVELLNTARRTGADNVGGVVVPRVAKGTVQELLVIALTTHPFGVGGSRFRVKAPEGPADTVPFGCYRRDVFDRVGYFDERLIHSQDFEFNQRLIRSGGRIWLNPAIEVGYHNQQTLRAFFRKVITRDGPWNPYMWHLAPFAFRWRHAVPLFFVIALAVAALSAAWISGGWILIAAILLPYLALAILSAAQQAVRYRMLELSVLLPALFFAYHLAYGAGEVFGIVQLTIGRAPTQRATASL